MRHHWVLSVSSLYFPHFDKVVSIFARNELDVSCEVRTVLRRRHSLNSGHEGSSSDSIITTVLLQISPHPSSHNSTLRNGIQSISSKRERLLYLSHVYVMSARVSIYSVSHAAY